MRKERKREKETLTFTNIKGAGKLLSVCVWVCVYGCLLLLSLLLFVVESANVESVGSCLRLSFFIYGR